MAVWAGIIHGHCQHVFTRILDSGFLYPITKQQVTSQPKQEVEFVNHNDLYEYFVEIVF